MHMAKVDKAVVEAGWRRIYSLSRVEWMSLSRGVTVELARRLGEIL